ncbi:MAG: GNAT family N-acetyltransferase [bacterium]|nr:GNAT family N-acetyltransferase [bacterium]
MNIQYKFLTELTDDEKKIRYEVFVNEQGFDASADIDGTDAECDHIIIYVDDVPAACCRYFRYGGDSVYIIGRVAVIEDFRGIGLGEMLMDAAEDVIRSRGAEKIIVHAQLRVKGFYKKCRYKEIGEPFLEEGVKHITMEKRLTNID